MASEELAVTTDGAGAGGDASAAPVAAANAGAAALVVALQQQGDEPAPGSPVADFLSRQSRLADVQEELLRAQAAHTRLQMEHLHEQRKLTISHMSWQHLSDVLRGALQIMAVLIGLLLVFGIGAAIWSARQDDSLVINAFSVPPDFAARGYSGAVVATRLLDHLNKMQSQTDSLRPAKSYQSNWAEVVKVEIPETGVSIGEFNNYLRQWLGRQQHVTGEVVRNGGKVSISLRAGNAIAKRVEGSEQELDQLIERSAEAAYSQSEPYRYAEFLSSNGRATEAAEAFRVLASSGQPTAERAWAYTGLGGVYNNLLGDMPAAIDAARIAIKLDPDNFNTYSALSGPLGALGRDNENYGALLEWKAAIDRTANRGDVPVAIRTSFDAIATAEIAGMRGGWQAAIRATEQISSWLGVDAASSTSFQRARYLVQSHDLGASRDIYMNVRFRQQTANAMNNSTAINYYLSRIQYELGIEDWPAAQSLARQAIANLPGQQLRFVPDQAVAMARSGDALGAQKLIDATPLDCYPCLRTRAKLAALKQDWPTAIRWFEEAAKQGPSLPFANADWGNMLLNKGDIDAAIAQFIESNKRGPEYPDALEQWGEALMLNGDHAGAVLKFAAAAKQAPRWGRLHLKWGEALAKLGKSAEAKAQLEAAAGMDSEGTAPAGNRS